MIWSDTSPVTEDHPLYYVEELIRSNAVFTDKSFKPGKQHQAEHNEMIDIWGLSKSTPLNRLSNKEKSRSYHLALHLKYWKHKNMHSELVERYENEFGNLDNVPVPGNIDEL